MSSRTYRVVVRGVLDGLDDDRRAWLRDRAAEHDLFASAFTEEGTTAYDGRLAAFSHRVVVRVEPGPDEEAVACTAGELSALRWLENAGVGARRLRSTATCTDDVRVRRR
ncbi:hypothetical protein SAMN05660690_1811 [Geodermatophilus telluris]|uniref:Uncharacterized protein n=1 Tax=Geodermatophilus telluris TaxID=1190417 RepID=A0A1G6ME45_9ACTN|nr:DUF6204 family protein [Geodermatophilus telluris]SDC53721.1 hypothetical protein SAMN05660690_1811 [Geodermatophilus telluris]